MRFRRLTASATPQMLFVSVSTSEKVRFTPEVPVARPVNGTSNGLCAPAPGGTGMVATTLPPERMSTVAFWAALRVPMLPESDESVSPVGIGTAISRVEENWPSATDEGRPSWERPRETVAVEPSLANAGCASGRGAPMNTTHAKMASSRPQRDRCVFMYLRLPVGYNRPREPS